MTAWIKKVLLFLEWVYYMVYSCTILFTSGACVSNTSIISAQALSWNCLPSDPVVKAVDSLPGTVSTLIGRSTVTGRAYSIYPSLRQHFPCDSTPWIVALTKDRLPCSVVRAKNLYISHTSHRS